MKGGLKLKGMARYRFLLVFFLLILLLVAGSYNTSAQDEVRVFITGPEAIATNDTVEYTVLIIGGPAQDSEGNWSYEARIEPPSPLGASVKPFNGTSREGTFKINVTAPNDPRPITVQINGTSTNGTNTTWSDWISKKIEVFKPIVVNITAMIKNPTQMDVKGALVSFYVDYITIGNMTVDVNANSTKEVYWEWIARKEDKGKEHDIEVRINEKGSLLEFDNGDNVLKKTVYIGKRPSRPHAPIMVFNSGLVFIIEAFGAVFAFSAYIMRRNVIRGRGYYSPGSVYSMYFFGLLFIVLSIPVFAVSQILGDNPEVSGDSTGRMIEAIFIFIMGFIIVLLTWDRARKKR